MSLKIENTTTEVVRYKIQVIVEEDLHAKFRKFMSDNKLTSESRAVRNIMDKFLEVESVKNYEG